MSHTRKRYAGVGLAGALLTANMMVSDGRCPEIK